MIILQRTGSNILHSSIRVRFANSLLLYQDDYNQRGLGRKSNSIHIYNTASKEKEIPYNSQ